MRNKEKETVGYYAPITVYFWVKERKRLIKNKVKKIKLMKLSRKIFHIFKLTTFEISRSQKNKNKNQQKL